MLVAEGLGLSFGDRTLFEGLDLRVGDGETVFLRGPSGSGKSSLLRLLAGLDPIGPGHVTLNGRTPRDFGLPAWRADVRYVPQRVPGFVGTPTNLLTRARKIKGWAGRKVGDPVAASRRWRLPEEAWNRPWHELSGGEQQRILLAIGLAAEPRVLLLDEPTSALDDEAVAAIEADLQGRTMLWITHDASQIDRIGGRVVQLGPT